MTGKEFGSEPKSPKTRQVTECAFFIFCCNKACNLLFSAWIGVLCFAVSLATAPLIVAFCRRKSTRLTAVFGGLVMALAVLFTSFAQQLHQVFLRYKKQNTPSVGRFRMNDAFLSHTQCDPLRLLFTA